MKRLKKYFTFRNFALFLIVVMCTRYIPIDTRAGVSMFKVAVMGVSATILLSQIRINNALVFGVLYILWVFFTAAILHPENFRSSTVLYLSLYLLTFIYFYTLIHSYEVLSIKNFILFIKGFIIVMTAGLIIQQVCIIAGIRSLPIVNLTQFLNRGIGANSFTGEPSVFARVMLISYYAYIKCNEYIYDDKISIKQLIDIQHRWVTIAFLWSMMTMGSGTAFVCLAILSLYFMRGWQLFVAIPLFIGVYFILSSSENEQLNRVKNVVEATSTGDAKAVSEADHSASARIKPMLNTLTIDLGETESWIGEGCDVASTHGMFGDKRYMGEINDYGLIAYFLALAMIFFCSINFLSLGTVMFFCGVGGGTSNIPYQWGLLMILSCIKYFHKQKLYKQLKFDEEKENTEEEESDTEENANIFLKQQELSRK